MRGVGPLVSFGGHTAILFWGLISFAPEPFEPEATDALPIEFVTISEFRDLTKGVKTATEVLDSEETTETPEKVTEEISDNPGPAEKPLEEPEPVPTPEVAEKPVEATPQEPTPEPAPPIPEPEPVETVKPEPAPEPLAEPEPVKVAEPEPTPPKPVEVARVPDQPTIEELIEEAPELPDVAEEEKPEPVAEAPPKAPSLPAPRLNPRPKIKTAAIKSNKPLDKIEPKASSGGKPVKKASVGTKTGRKGAKLTQTELDGLRDAIHRCWRLPPGYSAGRDFKAKVKARLSKDGRVNGRVNVVSITGFDGGSPYLIRKAVQIAIEDCQPYKLPSTKYAEWKDLEVTFYP